MKESEERGGKDKTEGQITQRIREQDRLPVGQRTIPTPMEPDGLLLARHEMNRLPTVVLAEFLASRRDASPAGPSLAENRTLSELIPYLEHNFSEVREGAVARRQTRVVR